MIALGNDHAAVNLKEEVKKVLDQRGIAYKDFGVAAGEKADYPVIAEAVCQDVVDGNCDRAILCCGTGVGMSMAANKVKGIRACVCSDVFSAKMTVAHNDCNVLCMGERVVGVGLMTEIVNAWLDAEFEGGRHTNRVNLIKEIEEKRFK